MNPDQQRAHTTRVTALEQRQDDLELVIQALAKQIVVEGEAVAAALARTRNSCQKLHAGGARFCDERWTETTLAQKKIFDRSAQIDRYTLRERLCVLFLGRP